METLVNFDRDLFLSINGMHNAFLDSFMLWTADRFIWIPIYVIMAIYLYRKFGKEAMWIILFAGILILISDQSSVLMKNLFERLRPCHDESLSFAIHTVNNQCGGQYGFVSSHAANTMALFVYIHLFTGFKNKWFTGLLVSWVLLIGYCRVYLGVHFPADIAGGWIVGTIAAFITYTIHYLIFGKPEIQKS